MLDDSAFKDQFDQLCDWWSRILLFAADLQGGNHRNMDIEVTVPTVRSWVFHMAPPGREADPVAKFFASLGESLYRLRIELSKDSVHPAPSQKRVVQILQSLPSRRGRRPSLPIVQEAHNRTPESRKVDATVLKCIRDNRGLDWDELVRAVLDAPENVLKTAGQIDCATLCRAWVIQCTIEWQGKFEEFGWRLELNQTKAEAELVAAGLFKYPAFIRLYQCGQGGEALLANGGDLLRRMFRWNNEKTQVLSYPAERDQFIKEANSFDLFSYGRDNTQHVFHRRAAGKLGAMPRIQGELQAAYAHAVTECSRPEDVRWLDALDPQRRNIHRPHQLDENRDTAVHVVQGPAAYALDHEKLFNRYLKNSPHGLSCVEIRIAKSLRFKFVNLGLRLTLHDAVALRELFLEEFGDNAESQAGVTEQTINNAIHALNSFATNEVAPRLELFHVAGQLIDRIRQTPFCCEGLIDQRIRELQNSMNELTSSGARGLTAAPPGWAVGDVDRDAVLLLRVLDFIGRSDGKRRSTPEKIRELLQKLDADFQLQGGELRTRHELAGESEDEELDRMVDDLLTFAPILKKAEEIEGKEDFR